MASLVIPVNSASSFFVDAFLRRYPEIADRLEASGTRIVVFGLRPFFEDDRDGPTPEQVTEGFRAALEAAEQVATPGSVLFVGQCHAGALLRALEADGAGGQSPLLELSPRRGALVGFIGPGEGGAIFVTPDGTTAMGSWDRTRDLVLARLASLLPGGQA